MPGGWPRPGSMHEPRRAHVTAALHQHHHFVITHARTHILDVDVVEALLDGGGRLVRSQQALVGRNNGDGGGVEGGEVHGGHAEALGVKRSYRLIFRHVFVPERKTSKGCALRPSGCCPHSPEPGPHMSRGRVIARVTCLVHVKARQTQQERLQTLLLQLLQLLLELVQQRCWGQSMAAYMTPEDAPRHTYGCRPNPTSPQMYRSHIRSRHSTGTTRVR